MCIGRHGWGEGRGGEGIRGGEDEEAVPSKVQRFYSGRSLFSMWVAGFTSSKKICYFLLHFVS